MTIHVAHLEPADLPIEWVSDEVHPDWGPGRIEWISRDHTLVRVHYYGVGHLTQSLRWLHPASPEEIQQAQKRGG